MKLVTIGAALAATTVLGCAAQGPSDSQNDEAVATTQEAVSDGYTWTPFGYSGGGGGHGPYWVGCSGGEVLVGLTGHSGITTDQIGVVCGVLNSSGQIAAYDWKQDWVGGTGGNWFQFYCPNGGIIGGVALNYDPGGTVNGIWAQCQTWSQLQAGSTSGSWYIVVNNNAELQAYDSCSYAGKFTNPPGAAAIYGFYVHAATYVDAMEPVCVHLDP